MNIQQVAEFYDDMFHSPEYKEMKAGFDKEDQAASDAELGHESDLSIPERSPKRQGMGRRMESKMRITKNQLKRIIREEKQKILKESALDDPGSATIPSAELISRLERLTGLVSKVDEYLNSAARGETGMVDMAFEANGDVEYHLQQLLGDLKGF